MFVLFWWSPLIPSRNLDEGFSYNEIAIISLRSHPHVITKADNYFIHNYIRLILNIILLIRKRLDLHPTTLKLYLLIPI